MKRIILNALAIAGLISCNKSTDQTKHHINEKKTAVVGSQKDSHGCNASAGQTWSELKQDCIQVFNTGFRLNPVEHKNNDVVISAFVIVGDDQSKAELFLPSEKLILKQLEKNIYENGPYKYDANRSVLYINGVEKYKGNVE